MGKERRGSKLSMTSEISRLAGKNKCLRAISEQMNKWKGTRTIVNENEDETVEEGKEHLKRALERIEKDSMRYKNSSVKPWLDRNGRVIWPYSRIAMAKIVRSQSFETFMGIVIMLNILLMIFETDADASCYPEYADNVSACPGRSSEVLWIKVCNILLQVMYTTECFMRAFVEREDYVWNRWNQLDLFTTIPGWITLAMSTQVNFAVFRTLRVVRLLRAGRLLISVPEIYILMSGLASALKPIAFGSVMLLSVIILWAIIVVEFLHPTNAQLVYDQCERCSRGFATVYTASLTLFSQLVAQDSWSQLSLPLAEEAPWTTPLLFIILMTVSLGVMNLILAVVVEKAAEARENDQERKMEQKENERERNMIELAILCDRMDNDGSGALSLKEMLDGFDTDMNFKSLMAFMDIERDDMQTIFKVLDCDGSGEVDYVEFCHHLGSCKKRDPLMMSSLTRYSVLELRNLISNMTKDIFQVLDVNTQMLHQQLDMLCHVPGLEKHAQALKEKSSWPPSPQVPRKAAGSFDSSFGLGNFPVAPNWSAMRQTSADSRTGGLYHADDVLDRMTMASKQFQTMQIQIDALLLKAEELQHDAVAAYEEDRKSDAMSDATSTRRSVGADDVNEDVNDDLRARAVHDALDERFQDLLRRFQQRFQKEEQMQVKCREIVQSIASMIQKPIIQNEL